MYTVTDEAVNLALVSYDLANHRAHPMQSRASIMRIALEQAAPYMQIVDIDPIRDLIHDMRTKPVADMDTVNGWIERLEKAIGDGNG